MSHQNINKAKRKLVGMIVPKQEYGNIGKIVEEVFEECGNTLNKGKGPDLGNREIKTRGVDATSPHTAGKMSKSKIISTPYENSHIKEKLQHQVRVYHQENKFTGDNIIVRVNEVDLTDPQIQAEAKDSYEHGRKIIADYVKRGIEPPKYIPPEGRAFYWERTRKGQSWEFRTSDANMKRYETISQVNDNPCFELIAV